MKAIEAAEYSPFILASLGSGLYHFFIERNGEWYDANGNEVNLQEFASEFIPLVPERTYKVGDRVTFLEALNSGMCFRLRNEATIQKFGDKLKYYSDSQNCWRMDDSEHVNSMAGETYTLCEDPSIPPKPTLESLPAWTRCKVTLSGSKQVYDVHKIPGGTLFTHDNGSQFWEKSLAFDLVAIYNPKTEQWEDV